MLIPEPSSSDAVTVAAAAVAFATVMESRSFYQFASSTDCWVARAKELTFADAEFVADAATDKLLFAAAHGLTTGDGPFRVSSSTALPAGLSAGVDYWAIVVDTDEIKLATTYANAKAATAVNITDAGTGTHTMSDTSATITEGSAATAGTLAGSMFVPAATPVVIQGSVNVSGVARTKLSVIRHSADGKASLTRLAAV